MHDRTHARLARDRRRLGLLLLCTWAVSCGVEAREYSPEVKPTTTTWEEPAEAPAEPTEQKAPYKWPRPDETYAVIEVKNFGEMEVSLFSKLAPKTVENFVELAREGFYDGTTFHRVIPGFMIQGGDPNSRDTDPDNDGSGGPGYTIEDEFSNAPHLRGVIAMANTGAPDSAGSQFFLVQAESRFLDGKYTIFGRLRTNSTVIDAITQVPRDEYGRFGPKDRPYENVVIERVRVLERGAG